MKNKSILYILLFALGLSVSFSSCEDMLTVESDRNVYKTGQDTLYSYWGIMKSMQNIAERYVILGETRGDLIAPSSYVSDSINDIAMFKNPADKSCRYLNVKDYYSIINNCNCYLAWADTSRVVMNNQKMMLKEYAQISAIRAWVYMQLVSTYGTVPFYTEPLTSLAFVDDFDFSQAANRISHADIADKLVGQLLPMIDVPYPSYGIYELGMRAISTKICYFPLRVVIADLYLMQNKYEEAAQFYYDYIKDTEATFPTSYNGGVSIFTMNGEKEYFYSPSHGIFSETSTNRTSETVTVIPTATNPRYGQTATGICELYGFDITSFMSDSSGEYNNENESDKKDSGSSGGVNISTTWNYKKQLDPSQAFFSLGNSNMYCLWDNQTQRIDEYIPGDARLGYTEKMLNSDDVEVNFIYKCQSSNYMRFPVIYRKALIWLRFAEAINRAGFPSYAYAILKDGLCDEYIPELPYTVTKKVPVLDEETGEPVMVPVLDEETREPVVDEETGEPLEQPLIDEIEEEMYDSIDAICYYIPREERVAAETKPYLDFSSPIFTLGTTAQPTNIGIHRRGGGEMKQRRNPLYDYDLQVQLKQMGKDLPTFDEEGNRIAPTKEEYISIVEELIVDELALETGFEGNRFPDLLRFANHKDLAGENGAEWLADKIGYRNFKLDKKACETAQTNAESEENEELRGEPLYIYRGEVAYLKEAARQKAQYRKESSNYQQLKSLLTNRSNWFLPLPAYK